MMILSGEPIDGKMRLFVKCSRRAIGMAFWVPWRQSPVQPPAPLCVLHCMAYLDNVDGRWKFYFESCKVAGGI